MARSAFITGILGQDGAYLAKTLLDEGYDVYGGVRQTSKQNLWRLEELGIVDSVRLMPLDLLEFSNVFRVLAEVQPDEVYNLAAQSFVAASFEQPIFTTDVDALGAVRLLESLRTLNRDCRFFQASTSEMYGRAQETPQSERTPFYPRSPYAAAKLYAHWMTINYREAYGMYTCCGILFNHESPLRGPEFVTRKITLQLAQIKHRNEGVLELGNLDAERDWGFAGDYVRGIWLMLQQAEGDDYILATGETHSVREFVGRAAEIAGFKLEWDGSADKERGIDRRTGREIVRVNPKFYRPVEVDPLTGDSSKARKKLGWEPRLTFDQLVEMMMEADLKRVARSGGPTLRSVA